MFIELKNITKTYNKNQSGQCVALKKINLSINNGEMIAIVGKSGSGKTTLLNILGLLDQQDSGEYIFNCENINEKNDTQLALKRNKNIGFILQDFALIGNMSVFDNTAIPLYLSNKKNSEIQNIVKSVLKLVGLNQNSNKKVKFLSGGQKQRVAIARAISNKPSLILADEPTGSLDTKTASEIMSILKTINANGTTIIIVTHDMDVAKSCERIICIEDGTIVES